MIAREEDTTYIATISGGKDSVTMCDLLLKNDYPVDYIIFNDTKKEYKEMQVYIQKLQEYFLLRFKKEIVITHPKKTFEDGIYSIVKESEDKSRNGDFRGLPTPSFPCHLRNDLKIYPTNKWIKDNIKGKYKIYYGFTKKEHDRIKRNDESLYPLYDDFKMSEEDCKQYTIDNEMQNTLYNNFKRTGCRLCPFKSETDWWHTFHYYKDVWNEALEIEDKLKDNKQYKYFLKMKPLKEWEKEFLQGSLFDFSDEPLKDCFCKI